MATKPNDEVLLKQIRDDYLYFSEAWKKAKEERAIDIRYLQGDPWDPKDKKAREDDGRPAINHDELNQYVNAAVNNVRQNKRAIKVSPDGNGATEKTADLQEALVRTIQKNSKAPAVFCATFQNMIEGGYGSLRVSRKYKDKRSFEQVITIKGIPNPDSVLHDPDCIEPDWSDQRACFVLDPMSDDEFKRRWPRAKKQDFTQEDMRVAPQWLADKKVLVAEYWHVEREEKKIYLLASGETVDELPLHRKSVKERWQEVLTLYQTFTNGVEILECNEELCELIPIIPMIGLERWYDDGAGPKREINSMIRLARDPQMSHAYLCSQEMEEAGLTPKTPYVGYTGQFETDKDSWETVTKKPHGYVQADPTVDGVTGQVLPLPRREAFTPNFQAYEVAKDSTRRAVQAAMGIAPLPTAAQRNNEKSGVALEKITEAQNLGSYHFIDSFDRALDYAGKVILSWIPFVYDSEREVALRQPDDSHQIVTLNSETPQINPKTGEAETFNTDEGDHTPDVSTGPSYQSQQEDAAGFLDQLISNLKGLPLAMPQAQKLLALAIQMRNLGPKGDEMAEIISPSDATQQQQQQAAQQQQQLQQMGEQFQKMQQELQKLQLERAGKMIDNQTRKDIEVMKLQAQVTVAEIDTKAQEASERNEFVGDMEKQFHAQAHDVALQAHDQEHQQGMAQQQAAQAQESQASDHDFQAQQAQQQPEEPQQ
jgi:hypothetical protein